MTASKTRPKLGELEPGQPVMVRRSPNDRRGRTAEDRYIPAVVVKAARIWVDLARAGGRSETWRMRRDTQDEGTQYSGSNASFATMDQHAWDETLAWARAVLKDHGLTVDPRSSWRGREIELADILAKVNSHDTGEAAR